MAGNEKTFEIECRGRDARGNEVLKQPIGVKIRIYQFEGSSTISSDVSNCRHNCGSHGERCDAYSASHPNVRTEARCPYSFDIPYALERKR